MHISLDSALGRQRRLNQVGETISSIAPLAAAYSLRSLTGGDPKVVRVRRSSNIASEPERDFTASEVSSGALVDFVNEIQTLGTATNSVGNSGFTLTNASSTGFTAANSGATGVCGFAFTAKSGDKVTVSFDAVVRSGSPQFLPRRATALSGGNLATVVSDSALNVATGSNSFEFTYNSDDAGSLTFSEDNVTAADFDISNFQVTVFKGSGFVDTWYDQSGNDRHAINDTDAEQPQIVSSGSLIADGIDFDGSDDTLTAASVSGFGSTVSMFLASIRDTGGAGVLSMGSSASTSNTNFGIIEGGSVSNISARNTTSVTASASVSGVTRLTFGVTTGQTSTKSGALGGTLVENTSDYGNDFTSDELDTIFLGKLRSGSASKFNGHIREALIYTTDQSSNRDAIEANIANYYNITLV